MKKILIKNILEKIEEFDKIAIFRHVFPDPDSYGSQNGLKSIIESTYPDKKVYLLGEHLEKLGYIGTMDESVVCDKDTLAIIVDVSNKERVDNQSFMDCGYIIKIDHHKPFDAPFEDLTWVDTEYSSCSEMILDFYLANSDRLKIEYNGRKALYTGIIGDTGRFAYVDNPTELFKKLPTITFDLQTKDIYANLYRRKEEELKFLGFIYSNYEKTENGVAYLKITYDNVVKYGLTPIINWHFFAEKEDGSIFCEFRSNGPRVNDIAFKYGGGGHMLAAGASVASWDVVDNIIKDMDDNCREFNK